MVEGLKRSVVKQKSNLLLISGELDQGLLKLDSGWAEVDVVIGGIQSNQANHQAAQEGRLWHPADCV
ncbi:MAG: hypothetical protein EBZ76_12295 [Synechococcaceae bacterium WB9_2_170]|nr:hypothetical protein [Synechococcaceae bacterium WB9_2_170]